MTGTRASAGKPSRLIARAGATKMTTDLPRRIWAVSLATAACLGTVGVISSRLAAEQADASAVAATQSQNAAQLQQAAAQLAAYRERLAAWEAQLRQSAAAAAATPQPVRQQQPVRVNAAPPSLAIPVVPQATTGGS